MPEIGTSGLMSGDGRRGGASASVLAPVLDSTTLLADVAQALVPAVSRLISTLVRRGDTVSKRSVGMSACQDRDKPGHSIHFVPGTS